MERREREMENMEEIKHRSQFMNVHLLLSCLSLEAMSGTDKLLRILCL